MWDYSSTIPTMCVLIVFYIFYMVRPRLPVQSKRTFVYLLLVETLTMLADIWASMLDENYMNHSVGLLYVANSVYFALFFIRIYLFFRFTVNVLNLSFRDAPIVAGVVVSVNVLSIFLTLSSFITGLVFWIDPNGYHKGPWYDILYVDSYFYLIVAFILLYRHGKILNRMYRASVLAYLLTLAFAYIIRRMLPNYLLMDMFCLFAIIIIYLAFENPEFYLDRNTGLFNRDGLDILIDEANGKREYRIVTFVIKDYQENRDVYGGQQMDCGLQIIGEYLTESFPQDTVFYVRNGRFAIFTKKTNIAEMCDRIRERFEHPWLAEGAELFLYAGFAIFDSRLQVNTENVINSLRYALTEAARMDRRDDFYIDQKTVETIDHQIRVRKALERALEEETLEVYLQPVVSASDYQVVGAEALARIIDPEMGFVPPDEFITIAEKNGSIGRLGRLVFEKTCQFIREHNEEVGLEWINVNLSPIQCMNKNLPVEFSEILKKFNISSSKIHLEITEQSIIDSGTLKSQMQVMVCDGFQFALDDYGSGYSNAMGVVSYPLSNIKIDREIVQSYFDNPTSLLPNEIKIFLDMDFSVTAEGVETLEMAQRLHEFGCSFLQGFYFSKPITMEAFVKKYGKKA